MSRDGSSRSFPKGYKQRVGIAQALLNDPPVLILDEPTIGLDPKQIHEVRELIKGLARNHTVVLSTHILPEVEQTCHRVIIIDQGKIVAVDTPQNLRSQIQGGARVLSRSRVRQTKSSSAVKAVPGVVDVRVVSQTEAEAVCMWMGKVARDIRTRSRENRCQWWMGIAGTSGGEHEPGGYFHQTNHCGRNHADYCELTDHEEHTCHCRPRTEELFVSPIAYVVLTIFTFPLRIAFLPVARCDD